MPGYRFRQLSCGGAAVPGVPALCDRAIVAQAELRTHLGFDFGPDWANDWGDDTAEEAWQPLHVSGPDIVVISKSGFFVTNIDPPNILFLVPVSSGTSPSGSAIAPNL